MLSIIGEFEWQCRDIGPGMPLPYTSDGDSYMPVCHNQVYFHLLQFLFQSTIFTMTFDFFHGKYFVSDGNAKRINKKSLEKIRMLDLHITHIYVTFRKLKTAQHKSGLWLVKLKLLFS